MKNSETQTGKANKIFTVVNPVSAGGKTGKKWPVYRNNFHEEGIKLDIVKTGYPGQATTLVKEALSTGYRDIMAVGGDGTVNEVVNGFFSRGELINPHVRLIIFSLGSGSDYIKTLGITNDINNIIEIINNGYRDYIDLGLACYINNEGVKENRYFVNIADSGIGGETVFNQRSKKLGGLMSYLFAALKTLLNYKNKRYKLVIDNKKILHRKISSVFVANGKYFAGGMKIAPEANLKDGKFNVIILGDLKKGETILNLYKAYTGNHLSHPKVKVVSAKQISINSKERVLLEIDGEAVGRLPAKFTILKHKLPVLICG